MRVIPIEVTDDTINHGEAYQWDEVVRIDFVAVDEIFTEETSIHAVKGRLSQYLQPEYVSSREIYVDLPGWLFESAAESAMVYAYDHGSTVAAVSIRITPRGGLPLQDETIDGLVAYRINLNMTPTGLAPLTISVSRFDKNSRVIRARMINGDTVYEVPDSASAMLLMTKADGFGIEIPCTVSNGFVYATLTEQACAAEGPAKAEIRITESGMTIGSANFVVLVEPAALDEHTVISDSDIPVVEQAIAAAGRAENAAGRAALYADRAKNTLDNFAEVVAEQVEQMQIHEGQTVIDGTLTVSGAAADAKVTGDRIRAIETAFDSKAPVIINNASGDPVVVSDGADDMPMKIMAVNITPVQDLHGYEKPWPAGGGKNLFDIQTIANRSTVYAVTGDIVTVSKSDQTAWTTTNSFQLKAGTYTFSRSNASGRVEARVSSDNYSTTLFALNDGVATRTFTLSADDYIEFKVGNNASAYPFDTKLQVEAGSSATAYEPYSNICPISGWTAVNVKRTGKNLLPNVKYQAATTNVRLGNINEYSLYLPKGTYTLSVEYLNGNHSGAYYRFQSDTENRNIWSSTSTATSGTLTIDKDEPFTLWLYKSGGFSADDVGNFWLELGSTATAYEPYNGTTFPVTLPSSAGTVYGGVLDVVKGTLTVTHTNIRLTSTNQTWTATKEVGTGLRYYAIISPAIDENATDILCSHAVYSTGNVGNWGTYNLYNGRFAIKNNDGGAGFTSLADFKTWLDSQDFQICYPLATPTTYTLTPTEIRTLLGNNVVYADAGVVDVQYPADTKLYIDSKIAELQALVLENA